MSFKYAELDLLSVWLMRSVVPLGKLIEGWKTVQSHLALDPSELLP